MKYICMRRGRLSDYKAVVFDLDGTLYYQKPFRIRMLFNLAGHVICHPSCIGDLFLIKRYREIREGWEAREKGRSDLAGLDLDSRQYAYVAKEKGVSPERVERAVRFFMLEAPLRLLPAFQDAQLSKAVEALRQKGITVAVYSDYPVTDKLHALGITADACFTSADARIGCMKPDPKGLQVILGSLGCAAEDAVMVGDRYEKDGLAAEGSQMDYLILPASKKERAKLKNLLC